MRWWGNREKRRDVAPPRVGERLIVRQVCFVDSGSMKRTRIVHEYECTVYWVRRDGSFQVKFDGNKHRRFDVTPSGQLQQEGWAGNVFIPVESVKGKKRWLRHLTPIEQLAAVGAR